MEDCNKKKDHKCLTKSNIFIYQHSTGGRVERKVDDCKEKIKIPICTTNPKTIKICTGKDLRQMCAPKLCAYDPPKNYKFVFMKALAVAAAVVYKTYQMGIWRNPDDTQRIYNSACATFRWPRSKINDQGDPASCQPEKTTLQPPCSMQPPIRAEDCYEKIKHCWNKGINFLFSGLAGIPAYLSRHEENTDNENFDDANKEPNCYF
ncbi:uncharacterized protein [Euwallacea fornicatus]|uniref:uncharacterized protein isoform X2 n=1 Tax=Euwallacea fornicatus TaxID=995702 RepID=UPI00338F68D0